MIGKWRKWHAVWIALLFAGEAIARVQHWGELPPSPVRPRGLVVDPGVSYPTLLVLGDSIPAGFGLEDPRQAWPVQLGHLLSEGGTPHRVVDAGIPGETSLQGWARWRRDVRPWRPRYVLIAFGLNDGHLKHTPVDAWRWAHVPQGVGNYIRLLHAWRVWRLSSPAEAPVTLAPRLTPRQTGHITRLMVHQARREGMLPILLTPTPVTEEFHPEWPTAVRDYQREVYARTAAAIRHVAQSEAVPVIDMAEEMSPPQDEWYQPDGIHLTASGHARYAEIVHAHLTSLLTSRRP